jgi:hypothetical protein
MSTFLDLIFNLFRDRNEMFCFILKPRDRKKNETHFVQKQPENNETKMKRNEVIRDSSKTNFFDTKIVKCWQSESNPFFFAVKNLLKG